MNEFVSREFPALIKHLVNQLFDLRLSDQSAFQSLTTHLRRLDLATEVTFVQWSKFPYVRNSLSLNRERLIDEPLLREQVVAVVADNLYCLLRREMQASHPPILATLKADDLFACLSKLWVNELTSPVVVRFLILQAVKESDRQRWLQVESIIDAIGQQQKELE